MANIQHPVPPLEMDSGVIGRWIITAYRPGHRPVNISIFRGAPTKISAISFSDPFGPKDLSLTLPKVTLLEQLGEGDLNWVQSEANIDVEWDGEIPDDYPYGRLKSDGRIEPGFRWEGYMESFSWSEEGLSIQAKGAMLQLDNYLAKPEYVSRPLPYEHAIARQFRGRSGLRLLPMTIEWPSFWSIRYRPQPGAKSWEIPAGVGEGDRWTKLLTRDTGKFDPALTSYIQQLLTTMYTNWGRWTLDLRSYRRPSLIHQKNAVFGDKAVVIDPLMPGVSIRLSRDFSQSMTTLFGQGTSLSGVSYTGMDVSTSGQSTSYTPLAATRQTWPADESNPWFDPNRMPREVMMQAQQGLDQNEAASVARNHLARFTDPGLNGSITLTSDPTWEGRPILRHLVRAGMDIQITRLFGVPEGIMAHVTESSFDLDSDSVTLTFDSKFRDALTAAEVRTRGRDALQIPRMLIGGQYQPPVPDQLYPWSYPGGSGYVPHNSLYSSVRLFRGMPRTERFPWTGWTKKRPPRSRQFKSCYIHIPPKSSNANENWASQSSSWGSKVAIPIKMSQAGTIRLVQIAAYRADGSVYKVPFHVSLYYFGSVNYKSMPIIRSGDPLLGPPRNYGAVGKQQHHPFAEGAFESYNEDGTLTHPEIVNPAAGAGLVRAWGTGEEKAGYWPGSQTRGGQPTGLLVDETQWSYDLAGVGDAVFDPYSLEKNLGNAHSGQLYMMIFCEDNDFDVYFLGRIFRVEPGGE